MTESKEEHEKRKIRELEGKNVAHYSVLLQAWIQTKMERDKTLVTLSAAGIGLLVTILTTTGVLKEWEILLYLGAFIGFLVTIWTSIKIYELNSQHIENELRQDSAKLIELEKYDRRSIRFFIFGAICACFIGIVAASNQFFIIKEDEMAKTKETAARPKGDLVEKSLNGLQGLRPEATQSGADNTQSQQTGNSSGSDSSSGNTSGSDPKK